MLSNDEHGAEMKPSAKVRPIFKKIVQVFLVLVVAAQLSSCFAIVLDFDDFWDLVLSILAIPDTPFLKHAQQVGARLRPFGTESTPANPEALQVAPFFGNLSVVTLPPAAPLHDNFILSRQADCSISFLEAAIAVNAAHTAITVTPDTPVLHYEKTIHNNASLTTTPDVFPHGCTDIMNGNSSRVLVTLGLQKTGGELVATLGNGGIVTSSVKADGTFTKPVVLPTTNPPLSVIGADLNKDGNPDVVAITSSGLQSTVVVFLGKADGTFQPGVSLTLPGNAAQVAVIDDLNGDGKLDILASSASPGPFAFSVFLGKGDGTFQPVQNVSPAGAALGFNTTFITADVRGVSKRDIVGANGQVFLNAGDGITYTLVATPAFSQLQTGSNQYAPSIVAADFNNDGKLDLATNDGGTIRTYKGNGDGTFVAGPFYATIPDFGFMIATDLDGDGNIDLWSGYGGNGIYSGDDSNLAYALMGNGDGSFQGARTLPISFTGGNFANLDGSQVPALIGPDPSSPTTLTFITELPQANGTFKPGPTLVPPVNDGADSWALGDFNGDGKADLIYLNTNPNTPGFYVALGNGDGSFQTPVFTAAPSLVGAGNIDVGQVLSGIYVADFNHDGKQDIAYSFFDQGNVTQLFLEGFVVQLGNGNGTFQAPVITTTFSSLIAPTQFHSSMISAVADVNSDNFPDVFLVLPISETNVNLQGNQVQLFVGKGDGSFKAPNLLTLTPGIRPSLTNGTEGSPFAIADLNGDGRVDLVVAGSSADGTTPELAIALGNNDGTFQPPTILTLEGFGFVNGIALADFDHNGKLDLFVGGAIESFGGIFPGNGNGTFQTVANPDGTVSAPLTLVLQAAGATIATDLNGDEKPDLIVGNVVLLNENGAVAPVLPATTTAVTSSLNPSTTGASVMFTATVTSGTAGTITGTASFFDGATQIGAAVTITGGTASTTTASLAAGPHSITAQFSGDANFAASTSPALTQTVNATTKAATSITIVSTLNPSVLGGTVGFDATVTSNTAGTITGTVTFFDGANSLGSAPLQAGGITDFFSSTFVLGANTITAQYSGDANFAASTSPPITQTVNAGPLVATTTTLTGPTTATSGASVAFMASVTPVSGTKVPTGSVTFSNGATALGNGTLNGSGSATFSTSALPTGTDLITAKYGGDTSFSTSSSAPLSINVAAAAGSFTLSAAPSTVTIAPGEPGVAVITVTPANGFNQSVQLSCSNLPAGIGCGFQPSSVTPNGGPVTTMLFVSEGSAPANRSAKSGAAMGFGFGPGATGGSNLPLKSPFLPLLSGELLLLAALWRRRKFANVRGRFQLAYALLLFATLATFGACTSTPHVVTQNSITVTATTPNNQTATVPLTIKLKN
jgi:hypothetical protein